MTALLREQWREARMVKSGALRVEHQGKSPLDYSSSSYLKPERLALIDDEVGDHPRGEYTYGETTRKIRTSPTTGRPYKNPRVEVIPGAAPGTVCYVDYSVIRSDEIYIHYMRTRNDQAGQGYATKLINALIQQHPGIKNFDWGKVVNEKMAAVADKIEAAHPNLRYRREVWY